MFKLIGLHRDTIEERAEPVEWYLRGHADEVRNICLGYTDTTRVKHGAVLTAQLRTKVVIACIATMDEALAIARLPELADATRILISNDGQGRQIPIESIS